MGQQGPWDLSEVFVGHLSSLCEQQEPRATVLPWAALNLASWLPHILKGPCKNDYLYGLTQRLAFHYAALSMWHSCRLGCCSSISPSAPGTVDNKQYLEKSQREMIQAVEVAPIRDYHSCMWRQNWWLLPQFWNNPHMLILQPTAFTQSQVLLLVGWIALQHSQDPLLQIQYLVNIWLYVLTGLPHSPWHLLLVSPTAAPEGSWKSTLPVRSKYCWFYKPLYTQAELNKHEKLIYVG